MRGRTIRPVFLQFLFVFVVSFVVHSFVWRPMLFRSLIENLVVLAAPVWLFAAASTAGLMLPGVLAWFIVGIAASVVMHVRVSPHMWVFALIWDAVVIVPLMALGSDADPLWLVPLWVTLVFFIGCHAAAAAGGCWLGARIRPWGKAALRACHSRS
jgi:hypothetical protein